MSSHLQSSHVKWFRRAVWLGILADWALGIPTIFAPEWVLSTLGLEQTGDPIWTAFAALLVVLLSLFYIPAANDPYRYKLGAWFTVFARPPGVLFFLVLNPGHYPLFGLLDGFLFLIQLPLLLLVMRNKPAEWSEHEDEAIQVDPTDRSRVWLKRTIWLGIVADWGLGIPAIFWPEQLLDLLGFRPTGDPVWTAFAAMILVLLGVFYVPGANDPYRYRANAWLAVFARPPGVIFFLFLWPMAYPAFALLDGFLFLIEFPFLLKVMQLRPERRFWDTDIAEYNGTSFRAVKEAVWANPYPDDDLPYHKGLGPTTFFQFLNDSSRNMHDKRDIRPVYNKLIHSNGISYAGTWEIDQDSPYTGYFAKGSRGLAIARCSVAGPLLWQGARRAFGMGVKVFPTLDPDEHCWPGNIVTVSHLSGSRAKHVLDIEILNYPSVGLDPASNLINRLIFRIMDTRPGYRQVFTISALGVPPGEPVVTPDLLMFKIADGTPRVDEKDFRDEIRLARYPEGKLVWDVCVRMFDEPEYRRIGSLTFTEDVASEGGDKQLHFWIPKDVPNRPQGRS